MDQQLGQILAETNIRKKYSQILDNLHKFDVKTLIQSEKKFLYELFNSCFDESLIIAGSLLEKILIKLFDQLGGNDKNKDQNVVTQEIVSIMYQDYIDSVIGNKNNYNLNYSQQIHKVISTSCVQCIPLMITNIIQDKQFFHNKSKVWSVASLLRSSKQEGHLQITDQLIFRQNIQVDIDINLIKQWIFNCNRAIQYEAIQIFTLNPKKTAIPHQQELDAILQFFKYGIKTSYPNFRKNYLQKIRQFFERLRHCYEKDFRLADLNKKHKNDLTQLDEFIRESLHTFYKELMPECCFEISNPCLEILLMIYQYLGTPYDLEIRKGQVVTKCNYLFNKQFNYAYSDIIFETLITQASSSWDSSRVLACQILNLFPKDVIRQGKIQSVFEQALEIIGSPVIRWFESGAQLISWIFKQYTPLIFETPNPQLSLLELLFTQLQQKFDNFKRVFASDQTELQKNLIHGYITTFWVIMEQSKQALQFKEFFSKLLELLREIIEFATQLSSENTCTWILNDKQLQKNTLQVDCRGHFYQDKTIENVQKLLQGNTLVESLEEQSENSENILVVAFFLITRESGMFFQQLAALIEFNSNDNKSPIETVPLKKITYQFFHALLNIKHIGSIDRIAQGLSYLCKTMANSKQPLIPGLVEELLDKLIEAFEQNQFKFIFRRSSGLPHLVTCLLKACSGQNIDKIIQLLVKHCHGQVIELKVHALNIMRKLFMETSLKQYLEQYIGQGFIISIQGFSYDDWSVRNSSLMLFSVLASKSLGKNTNQDSLAHKYTIIEFFAKSPELLDFFNKIIQDFKDDQLYPSLYPVALILSRLAPINASFYRKVDYDEQKEKKIKVQQIVEMFSNLQLCLNNKNYLGRQILSKSLLPFLEVDKIPKFIIEQLESLQDLDQIKKNHNKTHGIILASNQLLKDHIRIKKESVQNLKQQQQSEKELIDIIVRKQFLLQTKCPPIKVVYYQLLIQIVNEFNFTSDDILIYTENQIQEQLMAPSFKLEIDLQHSVTRKKQFRYLIEYYFKQNKIDSVFNLAIQILQKYVSNPQLLEFDDLEVPSYVLKRINLQLKTREQLFQQSFTDILGQMLQICYKSQNMCSQLVQVCLKSLIIFQSKSKIQNPDIYQDLIIRYNQDTNVTKYLLILSGHAFVDNKLNPEIYLKLLERYSQSENIDDLRVAVIKSLKITINNLLTYQEKLNMILLRLIQDEIPEIRNKVAKFISDVILSKGQNCQLRYNYEYILNKFFKLLRIDYSPTHLELLFDSDFYEVKKQNHIQKKIFSFEKANKYYSDLRIRQIVYSEIINQEVKQDIIQLKFERPELFEFLIINYDNYKKFVYRDEFLHENIVKHRIFGLLMKEEVQLQEYKLDYTVCQFN
ncbi:hypothetical protein pb186bvf_003454 [Paramecium bursaria]